MVSEENINQKLLKHIKECVQNRSWAPCFAPLGTLVDSHLDETELTQWVHHLSNIYIGLSTLDSNNGENVLKANKLLSRLLEKHVLNDAHYCELSVALLACRRLDESAAFLGAAIKLKPEGYESMVWALQSPCSDTWNETAAEQIFAVFDDLAANPFLINTLCTLHAKGIAHYRKTLNEHLLEAKDEKKHIQFEMLLDKGMSFIHHMIAYGEYESAEMLFNHIENLLQSNTSLRQQKDVLIREYRLAIETRTPLVLKANPIQLPNTLKKEQSTLANARTSFKQAIEKIDSNTSFEICSNILKTYQTELLKALDLIIQDLIPQLDLLFGSAPCHWAIMMGGSHGRAEMKINSDLEAAVLIEDERFKQHPYFKAVLPMLQKRLLILGEPWDYQGTGFHNKGLHIDGGNLNLLIHTPKELAQWLFQTLMKEPTSNIDLEKQRILAYGLYYLQTAFISHPDFHALAIFQKELAYQIYMKKYQWEKVQQRTLELFRYHISQKLDAKTILTIIAKMVFATHSFEQFDYHRSLSNIPWLNPSFHQHLLHTWIQLIKHRVLDQSNKSYLDWTKKTLLIPFYSSQAFNLKEPYDPWQTYLKTNDSIEIEILVLSWHYGENFDLPATKIQPLWEKEIKIILENFPEEWTPQTHQQWLYSNTDIPVEENKSEKKECENVPDISFTVQDLLSALIYHGAHPHDMLDKALCHHPVGWLLLLINSGIGRKTQIPVTEYFRYFEGEPEEWQPLIESTVNHWKKFNSDVNWFITKKMLFELPPQRERTKEELERFVEGIEIRQNLLKKEVYQQMFEMKNSLFSTYKAEKKDNHYGRRAVTKIQINQQTAFFKFYPEAAPMEDAVQQLAHDFFSNTIPHSELIRYENEQGEIIPILISEGIAGYNLQDVFNALSENAQVRAEALKKGISPELAKLCLKNIDHYSFSQHLLLTLFTNDEDGKPDNKYLVPFQQGKKTLYRIVSIDNDHSFLEPLIIDAQGQNTLQLKSILLCLDNMQRPLHPQAVAEFIKLNSIDSIEAWLKELIQRQERYFKLFDSRKKNPNEIRETLLKKNLILQLIFPKRSIAKLWEKWRQASNHLSQSAQTTGLELLRYLMPEVALFYLNAFKQATPIARFDFIAQKSYTSIFIGKVKAGYVTTASSTQLLQLQNIFKKALAQKGNGLGPKESLEELHIAQLEYQQLDNILKQVEHGQFNEWTQLYLDNNKAAVINRLDWRKLTQAQQSNLLTLLVNSGLNTQDFTLNHCVLLKNQNLQLLLQKMPGLQRLKIVDSSVTDKLWTWLSLYCGNIQSIHLTGLPYLLTTAQNSFLSTPSLELPELIDLKLEDLSSFQTLKLNAPKLKQFTLKQLPKLTLVETKSLELEKFSIQATPQLTLQGLVDSFETILPFKQGQLPEHWQDKLYINYPFLLSKLTAKWVSKFSPTLKDLFNSLPIELLNSEIWQQLKQIAQIHSQQFYLAEHATSKLILTLKDVNSAVCDAATQTLIHLVKGPEPIIPTLLLALKNDDWKIQKAVAQILGSLDEHTNESSLKALNLALDKKNPLVRIAAAQALINLGKASESVINILILALNDNDFAICIAPIQALGNLGDKITESALKVLNLALDKKNPLVLRIAAAQALINLGKASESVMEILILALNNNDFSVCIAAIQAFGNLGDKITTSAIEALILTLQINHLDIQKNVVQVLGNLGDKITESAIEALHRALEYKHPIVRITAAQALINLNKAINSALNALILTLEDNDPLICIAAIQVLGKLGDKMTTLAINALEVALDKENLLVRIAAAQALINLGKVSEPIINVLLFALNNNYSEMRIAAAGTLIELGRAIEPALNALIRALEDNYSYIRQTSAQILGQLAQSLNQKYQMLFISIQKYQMLFSTLEKNPTHLPNLTISEDLTEAQLIEILKKAIITCHDLTMVQICGLKSHQQAAFPLIQELIERNKATLTYLNLGRNQLGDVRIKKLLVETLPQCSKLIDLKLHENQLTNFIMKELALLFNNCPIEDLVVGGNQIDADGISSFVNAFPQKTKLNSLSLSGNPISAMGVEHLIKISVSLNHSLLYLDNAKLDEEVFYVIEQLLPKLRGISLKENQLKKLQPLFKILPNCPNLIQCNLQGNPFLNDELINLIQKAQELNLKVLKNLQQQVNCFIEPSLTFFSQSNSSSNVPSDQIHSTVTETLQM